MWKVLFNLFLPESRHWNFWIKNKLNISSMFVIPMATPRFYSFEALSLLFLLTHIAAMENLYVSLQLFCTWAFRCSEDSLLQEDWKNPTGQRSNTTTLEMPSLEYHFLSYHFLVMKRDIYSSNIKVQSETLSLIVAADSLCFKITKNLIRLREKRSPRKEGKTNHHGRASIIRI